jgi:hypothetical protein
MSRKTQLQNWTTKTTHEEELFSSRCFLERAEKWDYQWGLRQCGQCPALGTIPCCPFVHQRSSKFPFILLAKGYALTMNRTLRLFSLATFLFPAPVICQSQPPPIILQEGSIRVEAQVVHGGIKERYLALNETGKWTEVATSVGRTIGAVSVEGPGGVPLPASTPTIQLDGRAIHETFTVAGSQIERTFSVVERNWVKVKVTFTPSGSVELHSFHDRFHFPQRPDWSYSPSVGGFNPDAKYKAPLILVQAERTAFGIVPDLTALDRDILKRCNHATDLDVPAGPMLSVGFTPARLQFHSVYREDIERTWHADTRVENSYYLLITATANPGQAYRGAIRFLWSRFGRPAQASAAQQQVGTDPRYKALALWDDWRKVVWDEESPSMWLTVPLPDGSTGGAVRMIRWHGPQPSIYFGAWFNSMRTAYGMALYARREKKQELLDLAMQTVKAALNAPGKDGAFKCIALPSPNGTVWAAGDGAGESTQDGYLGFDMAWTGFQLLQWRAAQLPKSDGILERCERLADFFIARQLASGMLPTRFDENGAVREELSRDVEAETGPVARFLLELYKQDRKPKYRDAALRALAFLDRQVVPQRKWYDFETFWSCSPRLIALDERTQQWPANDLALPHAVGAYLAAFEVTGDTSYLSRGQSLLDYLLLYQQVWTNPALEDLANPVMLLGGFTTQNSDAEWSDARQSQTGNVLMDYYRATGKAEYLERGVAALRAQFPVSPSENWAHEGYGGKAGVSGFHWGSGSGMAGIEIEEDYLRDVTCAVPAAECVGVNGLNVPESAVFGDLISLTMDSPFRWRRDPLLTLHGTPHAPKYRLKINGNESGPFSWEDLQKGVPLNGFVRE